MPLVRSVFAFSETSPFGGASLNSAKYSKSIGGKTNPVKKGGIGKRREGQRYKRRTEAEFIKGVIRRRFLSRSGHGLRERSREAGRGTRRNRERYTKEDAAARAAANGMP